MKPLEWLGLFFLLLTISNGAYCAWLGWTGRDLPQTGNIFYSFARGLAGYGGSDG